MRLLIKLSSKTLSTMRRRGRREMTKQESKLKKRKRNEFKGMY